MRNLPASSGHQPSAKPPSLIVAPHPMLARVYGDAAAFVRFSQPKLDGVRALASRDGLWTRTGIRIKTCSHIESALAPFFAKYPKVILDGELYHHELRNDLGRIISLVSAGRKIFRPQDANAMALQFHIFDNVSTTAVFSERWNWLSEAISENFAPAGDIHLVETTTLSEPNQCDDLFHTYLSLGYEGQMLRADCPYEHGRSSNLLKRKPFTDEEFEILAIKPVCGASPAYAKRVVLALPDGRQFTAGISGTHEYAATLLRQPFKRATVRYSNKSRRGIPRSPVAVAFHGCDHRQF